MKIKNSLKVYLTLSILLILITFSYIYDVKDVGNKKLVAAVNSSEIFCDKRVKKDYYYEKKFYDYIILNKDETVKLEFKNKTLSGSITKKDVKIIFSDPLVASFDYDKNLTGKKIGKTLLTINYNGNNIYLMVIVLNSNMIDINNSQIEEYDFAELKTNNGSNVIVQDFVMDGKDIYLSYSQTGSTSNKKNLDTTINYIAKCDKKNCNNTKKYVAFKGSTQSYKFDMYSSNNNRYFILGSKAKNVSQNNGYVSESVYYKSVNFDYVYKTNNKSILDCFDDLNVAYYRMNNWDRFNLFETSSFKIAEKKNGSIISSDISIDESNNLLAVRKGSSVEIYSINPSEINLKNKIYTVNLKGSKNKIPQYVDKKNKKKNLYAKDIAIEGKYLYVLFSIRDDNAKSYIYTYDIYTGELIQENVLRIDNSINKSSSVDSIEIYDKNIYFSVSYNDGKIKNKIYRVTNDKKQNLIVENVIAGKQINLSKKFSEEKVSFKYESGNKKINTQNLKQGIYKTNNVGITKLGVYDINGILINKVQVESKARKLTIIVGDSRIKYLAQSLYKKKTNESYSYNCNKIHWGKNEKDIYDWNTCEFVIKDKDYPDNILYLIFMGGGNYNWFDKTFDNPYGSKDEFLKNRINKILKYTYAVDVNIIFSVGVNSLQINKYLYNGVKEFNTVNKVIDYIDKNNDKDNKNFYYNYLSINPINEQMLNQCQANNIRTINDIGAFNKILETKANEIGYSFCNSYNEFEYQYMKRDSDGCQDGDGIHYSTNTDYKIFEFIMKKCLK